MTEIRPIHESEAEGFLRLMCDVFGLDFNRAYDVFFTEPLFELERKWALFEGREMVSILTTSPLEFGWGKAFGIAGVATRHDRQGEGHASVLLQRVLKESAKRGEAGALLFARELSLYERNGFEPLDRVIRAPLHTQMEDEFPESFEFETVQRTYDEWSLQHPDRLRRDERRWNYWRWHYRICTPYQDGYLSIEPGVLREPIYSQSVTSLPLPPGTDWFGTTFMADQFEIPLHDPAVELYLMGRNIPGIPQIFMTDQF
ncbi:MAG: GNAT family N-acetyltransferase [Fimbriimonas sp.]|nr:GNAT family N-acetyltransferase [Fimbriimonas sp.]